MSSVYGPSGALEAPWPRVSKRRTLYEAANTSTCGHHIEWSAARECENTIHGRPGAAPGSIVYARSIPLTWTVFMRCPPAKRRADRLRPAHEHVRNALHRSAAATPRVAALRAAAAAAPPASAARQHNRPNPPPAAGG